MNRALRVAALLVALSTTTGAGALAKSDATDLNSMRRSLIRLVNYSQRGDWLSPWEVTPVSARSGGRGLLAPAAVPERGRWAALWPPSNSVVPLRRRPERPPERG